MKNNKLKNLAAGTIMLSSLSLLSVDANAENLFNTEDLGTGSDLRSNILEANLNSPAFINATIELKCGEGTCGEGKKKAEGEKAETKAVEKTGEHKCGEGKCGEEKKEMKKAEGEKAIPKAEGKTGEHKCGEGKCGN